MTQKKQLGKRNKITPVGKAHNLVADGSTPSSAISDMPQNCKHGEDVDDVLIEWEHSNTTNISREEFIFQKGKQQGRAEALKKKDSDKEES